MWRSKTSGSKLEDIFAITCSSGAQPAAAAAAIASPIDSDALPAHQHEGLVVEVGADPGGVDEDVDAERAQVGRRADAGAQQHGRGEEGAAAEDDQRRADLDRRAAAEIATTPATLPPSTISLSTSASPRIVSRSSPRIGSR